MKLINTNPPVEATFTVEMTATQLKTIEKVFGLRSYNDALRAGNPPDVEVGLYHGAVNALKAAAGEVATDGPDPL